MTIKKKRSIGNGKGIDDKIQAYTNRQMKWIQAGSFLIQPTEEGIPVFTLHSLPDKPEQAFMIYNGGDHALFFRNKKVGMILDYLNPSAVEVLNQAQEAAICEVDPETDNMAPLYRIPVLHITQEMDIDLFKQGGKK